MFTGCPLPRQDQKKLDRRFIVGSRFDRGVGLIFVSDRGECTFCAPPHRD